jgi:hypothetical protein
LGKARVLLGKLEYRSTPTKRWHCPKAQTVSVSEGNKLTMRWGDCVNLITTPRSSRRLMGAAACAKAAKPTHAINKAQQRISHERRATALPGVLMARPSK